MPDSSDSRSAFISEVFSSIQGEGLYLGERHLFIRFAGCGIHCSYCDEHLKPGRPVSLERLLSEIDELERTSGPHARVSLTGGEPLEQVEFLKQLLPELRSRNFATLLETNGICWEELQDVLPFLDGISMDVKLPSVGKHRDLLENHRKFFKLSQASNVYIKMVVAGDLDLEEFDRTINMIAEMMPQVPVFIQPVWNDCTVKDEFLTQLILRAKKQLSDVRLGIQFHKMINLV